MEKSIRACRRHGDQMHYLAIEKATGYSRWRCRRCIGEAVLKRKQKVRRLLVLEAGDRCQGCGYDRCQGNLHFHHLDPSDKEFEISSGEGKSLARFRVEAAKCVLVCANCHGEIERGLRRAPPSMAHRLAWMKLPVLRPDQVRAFTKS
jgi:hypothetical protein